MDLVLADAFKSEERGLNRSALILCKPSSEQNPAVGYLESIKNPRSRRTSQVNLNKVARELGAKNYIDVNWSAVDFATIDRVFARFYELKVPPSTMNGCLSNVKGVARYGWKVKLMSMEDHLLIQDIKSIQGSRTKKQRYIPNHEVDLIFNLYPNETDIAHCRNKAILAIFLGCGLRRAELSSLDVYDFIDKSTGNFKDSFNVIGKRNKERTCYLPDWTRDYINKWLAVRGDTPTTRPIKTVVENNGVFEEKTVNIPDGVALFPQINRHKTMTFRRISVDGIYYLVSTIWKKTGVTRFAPHSLRGTFATNMIKKGDLFQAQEALGHESIDTTKGYDLQVEERLKETWKNMKR